MIILVNYYAKITHGFFKIVRIDAKWVYNIFKLELSSVGGGFKFLNSYNLDPT
jgi:hypothetical protein